MIITVWWSCWLTFVTCTTWNSCSKWFAGFSFRSGEKQGCLPILLGWWFSTWVRSWVGMTIIIASWCFWTFISSICTKWNCNYSIHLIEMKVTSWWRWSRWWTRTSSSSTITWTTWSTSMKRKNNIPLRSVYLKTELIQKQKGIIHLFSSLSIGLLKCLHTNYIPFNFSFFCFSAKEHNLVDMINPPNR